MGKNIQASTVDIDFLDYFWNNKNIEPDNEAVYCFDGESFLFEFLDNPVLMYDLNKIGTYLSMGLYDRAIEWIEVLRLTRK